ncbi:tetratricopeptide repeat protein [Bacteroidia bacterium]|nr:tetratricopeptide repeat protein [Bacteroidia bacterium]
MNLKQNWCLVLFILASLSSFGQLDDASKKLLKKADKYIKKEKYEKAGANVKEVIEKYPVNDKLWKMYQEIMYKNYAKNYDATKRTVTIEVDGKPATDSSALMLQEQLNRVIKQPKYDYYNSVYYASLSVPYNAESSIMLRKFYIDGRYYSSKNVNLKSKACLAQGEGEFKAKNFEKAVGYYAKAYEEDSSNYKSLVYLGDTYYAMEYYGKAAKYFRKAIEIQPMLNEPRKYLADALAKKGDLEKAKVAAIQSLFVYPEEAMFIQLHNLSMNEEDKQMDRNWLLRLASINNVKDKYKREQFFGDKLHFQHYIDAMEEVKDYYDENGLLKELEISSLPKYLEVYSFRAMLEATKYEDIPSLDYARYIDEQGHLAPYLLINLFNVDLYAQYRDLVNNNSNQISKYISEYLFVPKK